MQDNTHSGHRARLRTRYLKEGLDHFEPHEILELMLYYIYSRQDTNKLAHNLLQRFGSLSSVFEADHDQLRQVEGIGEQASVFLKLIPDVCRRYLMDAQKSQSGESALDNIDKVCKFILPYFIGRTTEYLFVLSLDNRCRLIETTKISEGSVNRTNVDLRKITETLLRTKASGAILCHSHPRGYAFPSNDDVAISEMIRLHLDRIGITLLDHIIVAGEDTVSLANSRLLRSDFQ